MNTTRRTFIGTLLSAAGLVLAHPILDVVCTTDENTNALLTVFFAGGQRLTFPNVPCTVDGAMIRLPDCHIQEQPYDYTAERLTAVLKIAGVEYEISFPFTRQYIARGNTLTFTGISILVTLT